MNGERVPASKVRVWASAVLGFLAGSAIGLMSKKKEKNLFETKRKPKSSKNNVPFKLSKKSNESKQSKTKIK